MGDKSNIEWTDATWNPVVGCSIVSPGCTNCYAMRQARRIELMSDGWHSTGAGRPVENSSHYAGTTKVVNRNPVWTGKLALAPEHILTAPLRWTKPRMIFVNSMGDLFHEACPDEWIDHVFAVMALAPQHTFQVLTKRAERMQAYFDDADHRAMAIGSALGDMLDGNWIWGEGKQYRDQIEGMISLAHGMAPDDQGFAREGFLPLPNVWLGVSTEDQRRADERIPHLLETPASVRFISAEPLLGAIDLAPRLGTSMSQAGDMTIYEDGSYTFEDTEMPRILRGLDWVIAGGESGPNARPMHPDWARSLRDQCAAAGVPFFFKQWGEWKSANGGTHFMAHSGAYRRVVSGPQADDICIYKIGKTRAGRLLDGREHNGMPEARR